MIVIPGFKQAVPGEWLDVGYRLPSPPPPTETLLQFALREGYAVLNGPEHPVPVLGFMALAGDVAGYGERPASASLLLSGKRIGRVWFDDAGRFQRHEWFETPQEVEDGSIVLWPRSAGLESEEE